MRKQDSGNHNRERIRGDSSGFRSCKSKNNWNSDEEHTENDEKEVCLTVFPFKSPPLYGRPEIAAGERLLFQKWHYPRGHLMGVLPVKWRASFISRKIRWKRNAVKWNWRFHFTEGFSLDLLDISRKIKLSVSIFILRGIFGTRVSVSDTVLGLLVRSEPSQLKVFPGVTP